MIKTLVVFSLLLTETVGFHMRPQIIRSNKLFVQKDSIDDINDAIKEQDERLYKLKRLREQRQKEMREEEAKKNFGDYKNGIRQYSDENRYNGPMMGYGPKGNQIKGEIVGTIGGIPVIDIPSDVPEQDNDIPHDDMPTDEVNTKKGNNGLPQISDDQPSGVRIFFKPGQIPEDLKKALFTDDTKQVRKDQKSKNFEVAFDPEITFDGIMGYYEVKREMMQCADCILNYTKYEKYNVIS